MSWRDRAIALANEHSARDLTGSNAMSLAMAELWLLAKEAPGQDLEVAFRNLPEELLDAASLVFEEQLAGGRLSWKAGSSVTNSALPLGAALRALDQTLSSRPRSTVFAGRSNGDQFLVEGADAYVIPRPSAKPLRQPRGAGAGLGRRATPNHRILPTSIGEIPVEVHTDTRLLPGLKGDADLACGAALFPGFSVKRKDGMDLWLAGATACPDEEAVLATQVAGAFEQPLLAAVWPELTMPKERRELLAAMLHRTARASLGSQGPAMVVAGSWHDEANDNYRNVSRILDRSGRERLQVEKLRAYVRSDVEGIERGSAIKVLASPDMLVSFAICLDFCDIDADIPALALDVDLILVTSLGNSTTMNGHEQNADKVNARYGASAFVVQQNDKPAPVGFVHPRSGKDASEERAWSTRPVRANRRVEHERS